MQLNPTTNQPSLSTHGPLMLGLNWAYQAAGDLERARELFEDILRQTQVTQHELVEAIALRSLADIAVDEGPPSTPSSTKQLSRKPGSKAVR